MSNALADLFEDLTQSLRQDRDQINDLDHAYDGDTGDNMVENFATITRALRETDGRNMTVDQALNHASDVLQQNGRGAMAPIYAAGLQDAAKNLMGRQSFALNDIKDLLGGLLSGAQRAGGQQKAGSMFDALVPGVTTFLQSRKNGASLIESLMQAFMASQRGTYGTARQDGGFGSFAEKNTGGRIDPGAAAANSVLGGLLGSLLSGGLSAGRGEQARTPGLNDLFSGGLGDLFGGALGGLLGSSAGGAQSSEPRARIGPDTAR